MHLRRIVGKKLASVIVIALACGVRAGEEPEPESIFRSIWDACAIPEPQCIRFVKAEPINDGDDELYRKLSPFFQEGVWPAEWLDGYYPAGQTFAVIATNESGSVTLMGAFGRLLLKDTRRFRKTGSKNDPTVAEKTGEPLFELTNSRTGEFRQCSLPRERQMLLKRRWYDHILVSEPHGEFHIPTRFELNEDQIARLAEQIPQLPIRAHSRALVVLRDQPLRLLNAEAIVSQGSRDGVGEG